ncbi:MAG: hypothetical protein KDB00_26210 [Planctomycetales bacterium]|nr:hypothetical protein [Planctomycetales bacterium]
MRSPDDCLHSNADANRRRSLRSDAWRWPLVGAKVVAGLVFAGLLNGSDAQAQSLTGKSLTGKSLTGEIAEAAQQSATQLDPNRIVDLETTRDDFLAAAENLRLHLTRTASDENAQAWIKYLEIDPVLKGIESDASDTDLALMSIRVSQKATGVHPGLEVPAVTRIRSAAEAYSNSLRFHRKENTTKALAVQLNRFAEQWASIESDPSPDEIATLRLLLDLLQRTGQNVDLVDRTRQRFSSANLHITVGDGLIQRTVNRNVNQCSPVRDCILGTRIVGDALLTGNVTATLRPSIGSVRMQIALSGSVNTVNKGYNGPVQLRTSGNGQVYATRMIQISESGVSMEPVVTTGSLSTRIDAIEHPLRLVRRIARKKAAEQKPKADQIGHRKFIARVTDSFTEETDEALSQPMPDLMGQAQPYLRRLDFVEPSRTIGSTDRSLFLYATVRKDNQLAAPLPPPPVRVENDATIQLHESIVDNTIGTLLAGRTMTRTELEQMAKKAKRNSADKTVTTTQEDEEPEFEIDFDRSRPIIFEAREGKLRVGIRGTRFSQGSRELKRPLEIVAVYQPVWTQSGQMLLERVDEVQINFPGTKQLSVAQAGLRGSIKKGFADAFPQNLMDKPWIIPADVKAPALRGMHFRPSYFDANDGWLTLGVRS